MSGSPAYLCQVCHGSPEWYLLRHGDAVVTWSCGPDLDEVLRDLQRPGEHTQVTVMKAAA